MQLTTLQTIGAAAASLTSIWVFVKVIWPGLTKAWRAVACAWGRTKKVIDTLEKMPGLLTEYLALKTTVDDLTGVAAAVKGAVLDEQGQSRIAQLHDQGNARGEQLARVDRKVDSLAQTIRATQNANPRLATFHADHDGLLFTANRTFLQWTGLPLEDALRWGWINAVHPDDVERVRAAVRSAIADARRISQLRFRLVHVNGSVVDVEGSAEPVPEGSSPAERWEWFLYRTGAQTQQAAA